MKPLSKWVLLGAALVGAVVVSLFTGEPSPEVLSALRIPRVLLGLGVGGALALSGVLLQAAFANPLCEPYTLGVSSGAALGVAVGATIGFDVQFFGVASGAVAGALAFAFVIQWVASRRRASPSLILVSGAILGLAASSFVTVWMSLVEIKVVQESLWWLLGDLSRARVWTAMFLIGVVGMTLAFAMGDRKQFDALLLGDFQTRAFGYDPAWARQRAVLLSSLLVGAGVSCAGVIGFVGLVAPHLARVLFRSALHARVLPAATLIGAILVTFGDGLSRLCFPSFEVPVGAMTAILGAPIALWILLNHSSESPT